MQPSSSLTLRAQGGVLRQLQSKCRISQGFDPANVQAQPPLFEYDAIWDTGATGSVITQAVVDACGLQPIGMMEVHGVHGKKLSESYLVNVFLPNGVGFQHIEVTKGELGGGVDVLIGMDIITMGDFSITNKGGVTVFSFRFPSQVHVDYVQEHRAQQLKDAQTHGSSGTGRKKTPKAFGKSKQKKKF